MGVKERFEAVPGEILQTRSPLQPLTPQSYDVVVVPLHLPCIPRDAVVGIVTLHLHGQSVTLLEDRLMAVGPTPVLHREQRSSKAALGRDLPHYHFPLLGFSPDVGEAKKVERWCMAV